MVALKVSLSKSTNKPNDLLILESREQEELNFDHSRQDVHMKTKKKVDHMKKYHIYVDFGRTNAMNEDANFFVKLGPYEASYVKLYCKC